MITKALRGSERQNIKKKTEDTAKKKKIIQLNESYLPFLLDQGWQ